MKTLFHLMLFILILLSNFSCFTRNNYTTIYCGPNKTNPTMVLRNPEMSYPVYAKEYDNGIKTTVDVLKKVEVTADIDLKNKVVQLRDNLNQESAKMEILVKTNYLAFNARPCDPVVRDKFYNFLDTLAKKVYKLDELKLALGKTIEPSNKISMHTKPLGTNADSLEQAQIIQKNVINEDLNNFIAQYNFINQDIKHEPDIKHKPDFEHEVHAKKK